ncbi:MAG: hypothetical protein HN707_13180 [Verrucomicrobia bacterium]|nr:hypothetical protein [Verrucomicrobiota bacterium]MBT7735851.1 hypothetical protein [Verrucomicrobiota bacterium]
MPTMGIIMQVAGIQVSAQKLSQSAWSDLRQSLTAEPAEAAQLRVKSREQSAIAAKLLQTADENDKRVLDMVA